MVAPIPTPLLCLCLFAGLLFVLASSHFENNAPVLCGSEKGRLLDVKLKRQFSQELENVLPASSFGVGTKPVVSVLLVTKPFSCSLAGQNPNDRQAAKTRLLFIHQTTPFAPIPPL